jgi:hypothetical protein
MLVFRSLYESSWDLVYTAWELYPDKETLAAASSKCELDIPACQLLHF